VFQHLVKEQGLQSYFFVDSAGTSAWHTGEPANSKSQITANKYGVHLGSRARQFETSDLETFDLILAMDKENLKNILQLDTHNRYGDKIKLMREFDPTPGNGEVPDPYYGGMDGFDDVYHMVNRCCQTILEKLTPHIQK
jgi:protein-tyrosine phosphatase